MPENENINEEKKEENVQVEQTKIEPEKKKKRKNVVKGFFGEFKKFITRGNIIDLSVGVIIGGAFTAVVTALTTHIFQPLINALLSLAGGNNALEAARTVLKRTPESGEIDWSSSIYIDWGAFISAIVNFILVALILFLIVKIINSLADKKIKLEAKAKEEYYKKHPEERPLPEAKKETELDVLTEIRDCLKNKETKK